MPRLRNWINFSATISRCCQLPSRRVQSVLQQAGDREDDGKRGGGWEVEEKGGGVELVRARMRVRKGRCERWAMGGEKEGKIGC